MSETLNPLKGYGKIGFFGIGCSNLSLAELLSFRQSVTLRSDTPIDRATLPEGLRGARIFEKEHALDQVDEDILILSPSVRRDRQGLVLAKKRGVRLSSDLELFLEHINAPLIAVSGSDGKSTTATLVHKILSESGKRSVLTGNVGIPMYRSLHENAELYVAELSSFMLQSTAPKCERAYVTNISENHLDWHKDFEEYKSTKLSLIESADKKVINLDDPILESHAFSAYATVSLSKSDGQMKKYGAPLRISYSSGIIQNGRKIVDESALVGWHSYNIQNLMGAIALSHGYSTPEGIKSAVRGFRSLAHRAECVSIKDGIKYVNSSIDTTPIRTKNTVNEIGGSIVLILGGKGKGLSYEPLTDAVRRHVRVAVITGESAEEIKEALSGYTDCRVISDFCDAVRHAKAIAKVGECVLLSPSATSHDRFKNYRERGDLFKKIVTESLSQDDKNK